MTDPARDPSTPATGWFKARLAASEFGVLATHGADRRLDLVPCCFAMVDVDGSEGATGSRIEVVTAIDHKPKRTTRLARLANVERDPSASLLVDHRDPDDWSKLWWVRVSGSARVVEQGDEWRSAIDALVEKYTNYRARPPRGPAIRLTVERWVGWAADTSDTGPEGTA